MKIQFFTFITVISSFGLLLSSCNQSVTNVYDYYILNNVETQEAGKMNSGKTKVLLRNQETVNKAQLELIAYKSDKAKYLVIGSHKIAKSFYIHDSIYYFDVNDLYSRVRGNDFIRQLGDLSIYFTNIPMDKCEAFLVNLDKLKSEYMRAGVPEGTLSHFTLAISSDVFVNVEKKFTGELIEYATVTIWVNRRKHSITLDELVKAIQELKGFN